MWFAPRHYLASAMTSTQQVDPVGAFLPGIDPFVAVDVPRAPVVSCRRLRAYWRLTSLIRVKLFSFTYCWAIGRMVDFLGSTWLGEWLEHTRHDYRSLLFTSTVSQREYSITGRKIRQWFKNESEFVLLYGIEGRRNRNKASSGDIMPLTPSSTFYRNVAFRSINSLCVFRHFFCTIRPISHMANYGRMAHMAGCLGYAR